MRGFVAGAGVDPDADGGSVGSQDCFGGDAEAGGEGCGRGRRGGEEVGREICGRRETALEEGADGRMA